MSNSGNIHEHIKTVCEKARNMCSWILRTFTSRSPVLMLTLWKSLVLPILDYCSQLWSPTNKGLIQQIESIQQSFTRKIAIGNLTDNYWDRLSHPSSTRCNVDVSATPSFACRRSLRVMCLTFLVKVTVVFLNFTILLTEMVGHVPFHPSKETALLESSSSERVA